MKKKYVIPFAVLLSVASLAGCGKKDENPYSKYVTLGDYTGMTIDRIVTTISDDDVQNEIQNDLYADADFKEVTDRGAKEGDTVNIDYTGTINGKEFEGGSDTDYDLELGSGTFLDDFETGIIGMKAGETKDITVTFPDEYDGTLDGQTAVFSVTVNSISEVILPDYNDAYVKENYGFDTIADFEASVKEDLQSQYDEDATYTACADALSMAVDNATFDGYPEDMYNTAKEQMESENQAFAEQLGIEWADLAGDDYDIEEDVLNNVHEELVVYAIAAKEKLEVTDDEFNTFVDDNWEMYEYDTKEDFLKDNSEEDLRYSLLYQKVLDFLGENNTFNDIDEDEYYADEDFLDDAYLDSEDDSDTELEPETDTADAEAVSEMTTETESENHA
mgnify:FL=1